METRQLRCWMAALAATALAACAAPAGPEPPLSSSPGAVLPDVPDRPDPRAVHVIYLHGITLDRAPDDAARGRFRALVAALSQEGVTVVAEIRPPGTIQKSPEDLERYARRVASQVHHLLAAGVPARRVNVVGYSRGGVIAQMVSGYVAHDGIGYAVLAGCVSEQGAAKQFAPVMFGHAQRLRGAMLSITEASDPDFASCAPYTGRAAQPVAMQEVVLQTGKGHLLFAQAEDSWLRPLANWLRARAAGY